jgi:hypothetical protein
MDFQEIYKIYKLGKKEWMEKLPYLSLFIYNADKQSWSSDYLKEAKLQDVLTTISKA